MAAIISKAVVVKADPKRGEVTVNFVGTDGGLVEARVFRVLTVPDLRRQVNEYRAKLEARDPSFADILRDWVGSEVPLPPVTPPPPPPSPREMKRRRFLAALSRLSRVQPFIAMGVLEKTDPGVVALRSAVLEDYEFEFLDIGA